MIRLSNSSDFELGVGILTGDSAGSARMVKTGVPLADRIRPTRLEEVVGQDHLIGEGKLLTEMVATKTLPSLIFWGPPGSGKTTVARIVAGAVGAHFVEFSAVMAGVKEVRQIVAGAGERRKAYDQETVLFVDEIHRFNKAQQDAFLPHVESGLLTLIGATTENPSFEVIAPLLSRCKVLVLHPLTPEEIQILLERALEDSERGLGALGLGVEEGVLGVIAQASGGDARVALNALELAAGMAGRGSTEQAEITLPLVQEALQQKTLLYDKAGEEHYNLISALHKSLRGSDPDASLYWLARMLEAGEDPLYIARRLVRFASEDVGLADPHALQVTVATKEAVHFLGMPEGDTALAQAVIYLASAPKSNRVYEAYRSAVKDVGDRPAEPVPLHLRNPETGLMRELGYGKGYRYPHDYPEGVVEQAYLPEGLRGRRYYQPSERGFEARIAERLKRWEELKRSRGEHLKGARVEENISEKEG